MTRGSTPRDEDVHDSRPEVPQAPLVGMLYKERLDAQGGLVPIAPNAILVTRRRKIVGCIENTAIHVGVRQARHSPGQQDPDYQTPTIKHRLSNSLIQLLRIGYLLWWVQL